MLNYGNEVDAFRARADIAEIDAEFERLTMLAEENARNTAGVADTFDCMVRGLTNTVLELGGHDVDYIMRDSITRILEGVANVHEQVMRNNQIAETMYAELCPNVYAVIKEALNYGL